MESKKVVDTAYNVIGIVFFGIILFMGVAFVVNLVHDVISRH